MKNGSEHNASPGPSPIGFSERSARGAGGGAFPAGQLSLLVRIQPMLKSLSQSVLFTSVRAVPVAGSVCAVPFASVGKQDDSDICKGRVINLQ